MVVVNSSVAGATSLSERCGAHRVVSDQLFKTRMIGSLYYLEQDLVLAAVLKADSRIENRVEENQTNYFERVAIMCLKVQFLLISS